MFVVRLTYERPLADVDALLPAHRQYLEAMYGAGIFLLSGRTEPRDGGVILACAATLAELQSALALDPFQAVASYTVIEFLPSMAAPPLASLVAG